MTGPRDGEPVPELTTTRVGGSGRAKLIALAAVVVLGSAIFLGLSGRTATAPKASPVAAVPTAKPGPERTFPPINTVQQIRDPNAPLQYQYLGTALTLGGQEFIASLEQQAPRNFYGAYRIPVPWPDDHGTIRLAEMSSTVSHDTFDGLGSWDVSLDILTRPGSLGAVVLDAIQLPTPTMIVNSTVSRIMRNGFRITARLEHQGDHDVLAISVYVGVDPQLPNEDYSLNVHAGTQDFDSQLQAVEPGRFNGVVVLPDGFKASSLAVQVNAIPMADPLLGAVPVGSWRMVLAPTNDVAVGQEIFNVSVAPAKVGPGQAQIVANGYTFTADYSALNGSRVISFELTVHPRSDPILQSAPTQVGGTAVQPRMPPSEGYAMSVATPGGLVSSSLVPNDSGDLEATISLAGVPSDGRLPIDLSVLKTNGSELRAIGEWTPELLATSPADTRTELLNTVVVGRPKQLGAPQIVQCGYTLSVSAVRVGDGLRLDFVVEVSPLERPIGDDGLIGWPSAAVLPGATGR